MGGGSLQGPREEMQMEESRFLVPEIIISEPRNVQFVGDESEDTDNLSEDEKKYWRDIFDRLDLLDNKRDNAVSIKALLKVLEKLENRNSLCFLSRQTKRKINR